MRIDFSTYSLIMDCFRDFFCAVVAGGEVMAFGYLGNLYECKKQQKEFSSTQNRQNTDIFLTRCKLRVQRFIVLRQPKMSVSLYFPISKPSLLITEANLGRICLN